MSCSSIYATHELYLLRLLCIIALVDTETIYPDGPDLSGQSHSLQDLEQTGRDVNLTVVADDMACEDRVAPNIRYCFVVWLRVEIRVPQAAYQRIAMLSRLNVEEAARRRCF